MLKILIFTFSFSVLSAQYDDIISRNIKNSIFGFKHTLLKKPGRTILIAGAIGTTFTYQFDKDIFNKRLEAFKTASLETMKHYLIEILDKNQLYVNYSEIEDATFRIKDEDKTLNYSFYKKNKDY